MGRQYPVGIKNNEHFMVGSTSLPPKIDGQLRRHVVIEIPFIKWMDKRSNPNVFASVLWWGEEGKGTIFRPANEESQKASKRFVRAIYGIISGPKRFLDYLNDMKVMLINIFNESDSLPIGRAQVKNLSSLSPSHSISGLYPVMNTNNKKIAEIKVHLSIVSLESLQEGGVEVPTPDGGLDLVEDSETFLGDLKAAHGVMHAFEKSPYGADNITNSLEIVGKQINTFGSNGKELRGGIMDSIVDSLEKLRNEMTNSCLKVDVSGPVMETRGDILASTLPNSSHLLHLQPADLILNSILDDDIRDFSHKFTGPMRLSDDQKLLEHDELYDLFYRNVPGPLDDSAINKSKMMSKEPRASLKTSVLKKDSDAQLPPKLRRELSQASGIMVLVNSFTAINKLFVKEVRSDRELSSDCMLSISLSKPLDDAEAEPLVKMKPLLVKLKGRVLQFNQKIIISRTSLDLEDQGIFHHVLLFKLLERTSLSKFKVICRAECGILDLLMTRERGALKVNLEDKIGKCLGSLEINLKMLLEQRENYHSESSGDETKNANKRARICESEERKNLRKDVPMYACLVVPQGHLFATHSKGADCITLKVRNHWSDSTTVKSTISKDGRVLFNLVQVHSLSLSADLVSKMKVNYVIVEVWTSNDSEIKNRKKEQLLGISKLPINTFHESFCNQERFQSSVDSTFPVVAIDGNVPIASPASGTNGGLLQVLLAMGTYDQVLRLMDFKMKTFPEFFHDSIHQLSLGSGERSHSMHPESVEHMLELCIESVTKLTSCEMLEEGECYIRFIFPDLQDEKFQLMRQQTSAVACIRGDVSFNESFRQLVILPHHVSLCWHICKAYSANKLPNELTFQLWLRNHFSKLSDQLIAEGILSLNEFFRAIDAKVPGLPGDVGSSSEFSIEMVKPSSASPFDEEVSCGFMNIRVLHSLATKEKAMMPSHANPLVEHACLSVQILRACGLKCAAQAMQDSELLEHKLNSQKGLNTFLTTSVVINGQTNTKVTRVVGGSFRPAFNTHFEFLCPLNSNNSLATPEKSSHLELFEKAYLEVNVYSTNVDEGDNVKTSSGNNILIGRIKIFLIDILMRQTGLRGWIPIERPQQDAVKRFHWHDKERNMLKHVGGIEMAAEFSSSVLLESILREERMPSSVLSSVASIKKCNIQLRIDNLSFPLESLLHRGSPRNASARCYITYKFFDQDTIYSQFYPLSLRAGVLNVDMNHVRDFHIVSSPTFIWYLTEEKLEIEVWMSHGASEDILLPQADDEHVGSGYVSLGDLVEFTNCKAISSGYCPLFNARSDYMGSACLHYNIQASFAEVDCEADNNISGVDKKAENFREEDNFLARVAIERAYHLPKQLENNKQVLPNAYVTFETSTSFESTKVVKMDCDPVWNDMANVWLSKEFLNNGHENNLMLKVWHKGNLENHEFGDISSDKCLGFASVDLKPLLTEKFQTITGFYNINDYNGSQQGQIKVSVTPLQKVTSPSNQIEMRYDKIETDDIDIESTELITKNITDALEELTTRLKHKISQSFEILSHPTQDLQSLAHNHPGDRVEFNEATNEKHSSPQAFEKNLTSQNSSPNIFIQNYNLEPCECDDFQEHLSDDKQDCICISINEGPDGNEAVGLFLPEDSTSQGGIEDCGCSSVPHLNFTEKSVQTETSVVTREVSESDLQNSLKMKPESACSTPSSLASNLAERKNILIGDWLSEHKRKVSQRIVAFKSFKVPSIEESQRIAKILANKLQDK